MRRIGETFPDVATDFLIHYANHNLQNRWILNHIFFHEARKPETDAFVVWILDNVPRFEQAKFRELGLHDTVIQLFNSSSVPAQKCAANYAREFAQSRLLQLHPLKKLGVSSFVDVIERADVSEWYHQSSVNFCCEPSSGSVTKKLDYLVIGDEGSPLYGQGRKGSKQTKGEKLKNKKVRLEAFSGLRSAAAVAAGDGQTEAGSPSHELLDEAEHHARTALDLFEQLQDPNLPATLLLMQKIAEARGDTSAAAEWRVRAEAAYAEAQERAGAPSLPPDMVLQLAQLALTAREHDIPFADALASAGVDDPEAFFTQLDTLAAWLRPT